LSSAERLLLNEMFAPMLAEWLCAEEFDVVALAGHPDVGGSIGRGSDAVGDGARPPFAVLGNSLMNRTLFSALGVRRTPSAGRACDLGGQTTHRSSLDLHPG
jgi:hypothetical protein